MTNKRNKLLQYIHHYRSENGSSPTIREMALGAGLADSKSVFRMIESLVEDGYLEKREHKARSLRLTEQALSYLGLTTFMARYPTAQPLEAVMISGYSVSYGQSLIDTDITLAREDINV